jgi:hypothetical protein
VLHQHSAGGERAPRVSRTPDLHVKWKILCTPAPFRQHLINIYSIQMQAVGGALKRISLLNAMCTGGVGINTPLLFLCARL